MLRRIGWRRIAAAIYIALNLVALPFSIAFSTHLDDWQLWSSLPGRLAEGTVYRPVDGLPAFVWSPVAAWLMAGVAAIGYWPWVAAHVAVLPLLRSPWLILLTACSWAFWWDTASAHTMTFVFVVAVLALRGSRWAALTYLGLFLLMPRPVQLPLAIWLLWRMPWTRWPFVGLFAAHAAVVLVTGYGPDWVAAAITYSASGGLGIGPGRYLGLAWLVVGVPLAALLLARGRVGWAGVAVTPYLLPQYLLFPLLELVPRNGERLGSERGPR